MTTICVEYIPALRLGVDEAESQLIAAKRALHDAEIANASGVAAVAALSTAAATGKQQQREESVFRQLVAWHHDNKSNFMKMLVARTKKYKRTKNIDVRGIFCYSVNCKLVNNQGCPVKCAVDIWTHALLQQTKGNNSAWWQSFVVAFEEAYGKM